MPDHNRTPAAPGMAQHPMQAARRRFLARSLALCASAPAWSAAWAQTAAKPVIRFGYVDGWADSVATTHLAAAIVRDRIGHPVELVSLAAGLMWQGVARGDLDVTMTAWLPVTHEAYLANFRDKVQILGSNYQGAKIGLVVPEYSTATSLTELNGLRAEFGQRIVGIDSGAGLMRKTEEAIKAYGLELRLQPSSGPAMTAELDRAWRAHKPIVVTGWIPHWMFAKYKLRFLADPKNIYGAEEHVDSVVHPGLNGKAPAVVALLKKLNWQSADIGSVMLAIEDGAAPGDAVNQWIRDNPARVAGWLDQRP